jgi:hypothetical protein
MENGEGINESEYSFASLPLSELWILLNIFANAQVCDATKAK